MGQSHPLRRGDADERTSLVKDVVEDVVVLHGKSSSAESEEVRVSRMGAHGDATLPRQHHGAAHVRRVTCVEAAGDVHRGHQREQLVVGPQFPAAEALTRVGVDVDGLQRHW